VGIRLLRIKQFLKEACWPTLITILGVAMLLGLGTWQMQRLLWKEALLEELANKFIRPVQDIQTLLNQPMYQIMEAEYQRIKVTGTYLHNQEMKWMAKSQDGKPGIHLITPFALTSGSIVLIDRGWVPLQYASEVSHPEELQTVIGFLRNPPKPQWFTPENHLAKDEFYTINPAEIARHKNLPTLLPFFLVEEANPQITNFPKPVGLALNLQNHHLQYAITWYTLALILAVFYILYIRKKF
jgi:surfeit locus 1 family protein